jgi:hypothetical protein
MIVRIIPKISLKFLHIVLTAIAAGDTENSINFVISLRVLC